MPEISVGIDLGTTNSCVSTCWPNGQPRLLRDGTGIGVIPSVVSFVEDDRVEVGHKGKLRVLQDPQNTFYSIKRFVGRDMRLDENKWAASLYPYVIEAGENGLPVAVTRGQRLPLYQISGTILGHLKQIAERSLDQPVTKAVITVPANFNEVQLRATHQAGEHAGLEVLRIFNEPTAAALAYGLGKSKPQTVAVYDFGGGTFDMTILRLEDPVFEVLATAGDMMLGGDDIDRRILEDMIDEFQNQYGFSPEADASLVQRFTLGAERMKCQLTDWIVTAFEDRHVRRPDGQSLPPFHYEINREKFKSLIGKFVDRSLEVCDQTFKLAGLGPADMGEVILVGGTTRIPFLRQRVQAYFARPPLDKIQPDVVVSIGAAIQSYALSGGELIYPAAARDMLPIRKVEPRPPAPKRASPAEDEFLDDFSEALVEDEKASERMLRQGKTVRGMPVATPPVPMTPHRIVDVPVPSRRGEPGPAVPPANRPVAALDEAFGGSLDLPTPRRDEPGPSVPPSPAMPGMQQGRPAPTLRQAPADPGLPLVPPPPQVVREAPAMPPPQVVREPPPEDAAEQQEALDDYLGLLEEPPSEAPVVTPDSLSRQYVPGDVRKEMRRIDREDAAAARTEPGIMAQGAAAAPMPEAGAVPARAPLLLDVTANTLSVGTVGGFVEVLIRRNSPVPIEKRHLFTTSADNQERAVIRVLEGESGKAAENHVLGEVELVGLRPAPRGEVKIEVAYELTVDGILQVAARNLETGEAQIARLTLFGG